MDGPIRSVTIGARVNGAQLDRVDAAARLRRVPRSHFIVQAVLDRANAVLREAVDRLESERDV